VTISTFPAASSLRSNELRINEALLGDDSTTALGSVNAISYGIFGFRALFVTLNQVII